MADGTHRTEILLSIHPVFTHPLEIFGFLLRAFHQTVPGLLRSAFPNRLKSVGSGPLLRIVPTNDKVGQPVEISAIISEGDGRCGRVLFVFASFA
jgi:hypothetical protein